MCKLLEIKPRKAGHKLVHFYELLEQYVIPEIKEEEDLISSINDELTDNGYIQSMPLTAQTVLWYYNSALLKSQTLTMKLLKMNLLKQKQATP